jgi:hypothetical protein
VLKFLQEAGLENHHQGDVPILKNNKKLPPSRKVKHQSLNPKKLILNPNIKKGGSSKNIPDENGEQEKLHPIWMRRENN